MRVERVVIRGYGVFSHEVTFVVSNRGLTLVLGDNADEPCMDNNGSGKSSVFEALDWCLFGVIPKGDHVDSIISHTEKECSVTTHLVDDAAVPIEVTRGKRRSKSQTLSYSVGGAQFETLDLVETQRGLERVLGMDREVFHSTTMFAQNDDFNFADTTSDVERMRLITKILGLGEIDEWLTRTRDCLREVRREESELALVGERLAGKRETLAASVGSYREQSSAWEAERAEALQKSVVQLNEMLGHIERSRAIVAHKGRLEAMVRDLSLEPVTDWREFERAVAQAKTTVERAVAEEAATTSLGDDLRARRDKFSRLGQGKCPECGQEVTGDHLAEELGRLDRELGDLRERWTAANQAVQVAKAFLSTQEASFRSAQDAHRASEEAAAANRREVAAKLEEVRQAEDYLARAEPHVARLRSEMATTHENRVMNPWLQREEQTRVELNAVDAEVAQVAARASDLAARRSRYEFWERGFSAQGLKSYILDARLAEMTMAANHWVEILTGGTLWVRFESQAMGRSTKKLTNKVNVRVFRYNPNGSVTEQGYRSWSGGEKRRVGWAINFGLSQMVARRADKMFDFLVLDEVFKHVDSAGGEAVVRMLGQLRRERSSIFVIEHDADFQSHFENKIVVRKVNGVGSIVEGDRATTE